MFPPAPTIVAPVKSKFLSPKLLKTHLYYNKILIKDSCKWHDLRSFNNFTQKGTTFYTS